MPSLVCITVYPLAAARMLLPQPFERPPIAAVCRATIGCGGGKFPFFAGGEQQGERMGEGRAFYRCGGILHL